MRPKSEKASLAGFYLDKYTYSIFYPKALESEYRNVLFREPKDGIAARRQRNSAP